MTLLLSSVLFFIWEEIYSEICSKYLGRKFVWNFYLIFLPLSWLYIILWCLGRNLFRNVYHILGKKILLKVLLDIVDIKNPIFTFLGNLYRYLYPYWERIFFWKLYLILLSLFIILLYLIRSLFWNGYHHFGRNLFWKCFLTLLTVIFFFKFEKKFIAKFVPMFWKKILLKILLEIVTFKYQTFLYLGVIFFCKFYLIFLPLSIQLLCLRRNWFWNIYQYLGRKFFWKLYLKLLPLCILLLFYGRNILSKCTNIWEEENSSENCTWYCTFVQMLHYILKCIHLEWRWLFGPFRYMLIQTVWLIAIPDEELFSETAVVCTASYFVKIIWCSCWFCNPPPLFWGWILLILRSPKGGCCSISDDLSCSCYHYVSYFSIWEEIYSEMFTNILEENSSVSLTSYCYHCVFYFYILEEIYSESTAYMLILHVFVHCIWEENSSETCFFSC